MIEQKDNAMEECMSDDDIMDFSTGKAAPRFKIDGDIFTGVRDIPAELALEFSQKSDAMSKIEESGGDRLGLIKDLIEIVLVPESATLFNSRLSDPANPIGITVFSKILPWLMAQYLGTPTKPGSESSDGSDNPESGTSSTGSSSDVE